MAGKVKNIFSSSGKKKQGGGYGSAPPPANAPPAGYGAPPQQGAYGAPPAGGYGAPPPNAPPAGGYGAPPPNAPPAGGGYRAPPPQQGGYGAPPRQNMYGQAPPPGAPPAGYAGGGYRPPGGAPGYGGYAPPANAPPPGVSPDLWQWFQSVDTDRSGKITSQELQQALMNGNWTPFNAETCRLMIGMFDRDKSGTIDIHEFAALWKYIQDWKACFDRFDTDRSGNINTNELRTALHSFGYNLSDQFCALCVRVFDKRHTRTMDFDNFIQCCVMLKALTDQFRQKDTQQAGQIRIHYEEFLRMVLDNTVVL